MSPRTRVTVLAVAAFLPSFLVGLWIADEFANMDLLPHGDRGFHLFLGVVAGGLGSAAAAVSANQQLSVGRSAWGFFRKNLRLPELAPILAFFGAPLVVAASVLPYTRIGTTNYRLVDFSAPASYWVGAAVSNWIIALVAFWIAIRLLLSDRVDRWSAWLLLGLGLAMVTGFIGLALQVWPASSIGTWIGILGSALVLSAAIAMLTAREG